MSGTSASEKKKMVRRLEGIKKDISRKAFNKKSILHIVGQHSGDKDGVSMTEPVGLILTGMLDDLTQKLAKRCVDTARLSGKTRVNAKHAVAACVSLFTDHGELGVAGCIKTHIAESLAELKHLKNKDRLDNPKPKKPKKDAQ